MSDFDREIELLTGGKKKFMLMRVGPTIFFILTPTKEIKDTLNTTPVRILVQRWNYVKRFDDLRDRQ